MATMDVPLPDPMKDWVEAQARSGRCSHASDDGRGLIRRDRERLGTVAALQTLIEQGLEGGMSARTEDGIRPLPRRRAGARRPRPPRLTRSAGRR